MEPYELFNNKVFIAFYKPPNYIMDTSTNYTKFSNKKIQKKFKSNRKPFLIYIKNYLFDKYNIVKHGPNYGVCQRLDINTSGIILTSIYEQNLSICRKIICDKENTIKIYLTLVNGKIEKENGFIEKYIHISKTYPKMSFVHDTKKYNNVYSKSYYQVMYEFVDDNNNYYSLVMVRIYTGRTHQIRVHMKYLGNTVVSDDRYINDIHIKKRNNKLISRMFLHNILLKFVYNDKDINISCKLPDDLLECLKKLKIIHKYNYNLSDIY